MQLTLRDFLWATVVIGLAIGIVLEHRDVRALKPFQGKAEWWEKAARSLGEVYEEKTGLKPEFKEMDDIDLRRKDGLLQVDFSLSRRSFHVRPTDERQGAWLTGHADLNMALILLTELACLLGIFAFIKRNYPNWLPKPNPQLRWGPRIYLLVYAWAFISLLISIGAFALRYPFAGAGYLFAAVQALVHISPRAIVSRFIILPALPTEQQAAPVEV